MSHPEFRYPLTNNLFKTVLNESSLRLVDAGASYGGEFNRWGFLGNKLELHAFEADEEDCKLQNTRIKNSPVNAYYHNVWLGKTTKQRPFYVTKDRFSSSFLKLDMDWYERKKSIIDGVVCKSSAEFGETKEIHVDCISLDDWAEESGIEQIDHLKVDIEGVELELLESSPRILSSCLSIVIDVIFHEDWFGAATFSDIDKFMLENGFMLLDLGHFKRTGQYNSPITMKSNLTGFQGQIACGDAFYVRDPFHSENSNLDTESLLKLSCISEVLGQVEYAFEMLILAKEKESSPEKKDLLNEIIERITKDYIALEKEKKFRKIVDPVANFVKKNLPANLWKGIALIGNRVVGGLSK